MIPSHVQSQEIDWNQILQDPKRKIEITKILLQALNKFGFEKTIDSLQQESNIQYETDRQTQLRQSILLGQWNKSIQIIQKFNTSEEQTKLNQSLILEQKYLELLESHNIQDALIVLRQELPKVVQNNQRMHKLASLMMFQNLDQLKLQCNWLGAGIESRKLLLEKIYSVSKEEESIITPNSLEKLVKQSQMYQILNCDYHSSLESDYSIIKDHKCNSEDVPKYKIQEFNYHHDEVWIVRFSPDGNYLASISKNRSLIIWKYCNQQLIMNTDKVEIKIVHEKEIHCVEWNPNSDKVATASSDQTVKIWKLDGSLHKILKGHSEIVFSVVWHPYNNQIYSAGLDNFIQVWRQDGMKVVKIGCQRTQNLHITSDGATLITISATSNNISFVDLKRKQEVNFIIEKDRIVSSYLTKDDKYLLINISYQKPEIHMWDLQTLELVNRFEGFKQANFVLRFCTGWHNDQLVACGSEDGTIFIWHINQKRPVRILQAGEKDVTINCVDWHPTQPGILAAALEDNKLQLWSSDERKINKMSQQSINLPKNNILVRVVDSLRQFFHNNEQDQDSNIASDIDMSLDMQDLE